MPSRKAFLLDVLFFLYMAWLAMPEADRSTCRAWLWITSAKALRALAEAAGCAAIRAEARYYSEVRP